MFEHVLRAGLPDYYDYAIVLPAMRRFAAFLRRRGFIPAELGLALDCDLESWIPRALTAAQSNTWWTRDGRTLHARPKVA